MLEDIKGLQIMKRLLSVLPFSFPVKRIEADFANMAILQLQRSNCCICLIGLSTIFTSRQDQVIQNIEKNHVSLSVWYRLFWSWRSLLEQV